MKSWNWRIVEFAASHQAWLAEMFPKQTHTWSTNCRHKGCTTIAECYVAYDYVTGRQGRVSTNEKPYCRAHAAALMQRKAIERAKEDAPAYGET